MAGRMYAQDSYRFGFNGKENDSETSTQDYGMRIYNPALGKFLSVDPLFKQYGWNSPYGFAENQPICAIDLDGAEKYIVINYRESKNDKYMSTGQLVLSKAGPLGDGVLYITIDNTNESRTIVHTYAGYTASGNPRDQFTIEETYYSPKEIFDKEWSDNHSFFGQMVAPFKDEQEVRAGGAIMKGIGGLALAIPSGGASLGLLEGFSILFSGNELLSGIVDATDGENIERNIFKEGITYLAGEKNGDQLYDVLEGTVKYASLLQNIYNLTEEAVEKNIGGVIKSTAEILIDNTDKLPDMPTYKEHKYNWGAPKKQKVTIYEND